MGKKGFLKKTRRKRHPWVWLVWSYSDMFCPLQTETLVLRAERRALCDCMPTNSLRWTLLEVPRGRRRLSSHPARHTEKQASSGNQWRFSSQLIHKIGTLFSFLSHHRWATLSRKPRFTREVAYFGTTFIPLMFYIVKHACVIRLSLLW